MYFSIEIDAPKEIVWKTLWEDETFRDWANFIDEGLYLTGELKEGKEVQFLSSGGNGVTSKVVKLIANELVIFQHAADTQDGKNREKEWTGGTESYSLTNKDDVIMLTVELDVPPGLEEIFEDRQPKALKRVKIISEDKV